MNVLMLWEQVDELLRMGQCDAVKELLLSNQEIVKKINELAVVYYLIPVCEQEEAAGVRRLFEKVTGLEALLERYTKLKFYLRRIDFDTIDESMVEFEQFVAQNNVSLPELMIVMYCCVVHKEKVLQIIQGKIAKGEIKYE